MNPVGGYLSAKRDFQNDLEGLFKLTEEG